MRKTKVGLIASLALNLVCAGAIVGYVSHCFMLSPSAHSRTELLAQFPEDKRALIDDAITRGWQDTQAIRDQIAAGKKEASRLLQMDPINQSAYLTQVEHLNDLHTQMKRHIAQFMLDIAPKLTSDERVILANIIAHPPSDKPLAASGKAQ